jgi:two-component system sensor histidine kinase PilS (NtrC family)
LIDYPSSSTQVGILGATLIATAIVTHKLTERVRSSERLVQQRERDVALLSALNQEIIENLQAGVIVLTENNQIRHINNTALKMLNIGVDDSFSLQRDQPKILAVLDKWRQSPQSDTPYLAAETGLDNIQISFAQLLDQGRDNVLIFLNDVSSIKNSMQQAKLASLGHLTASIAHEIRNPLGAISYAAQLLSENSNLEDTEHRMTEIIHQHSNRINHIIEDILEISRGTPAVIGKIELREWLDNFIEDFCLSNQAPTDSFDLDLDADNSSILFDSGHLTQIMTNLCTNARTHGDDNRPLHIKVYMDYKYAMNIEIADEGPGINQKTLDKVFEPFFTTSHQGSGLGLYIVSQLCELNDATISARQNVYKGSSFIIHPRIPLAHSVQHATRL